MQPPEIMQDIVYGKPVGITALSYMLTGYIVGRIQRKGIQGTPGGAGVFYRRGDTFEIFY